MVLVVGLDGAQHSPATVDPVSHCHVVVIREAPTQYEPIAVGTWSSFAAESRIASRQPAFEHADFASCCDLLVSQTTPQPPPRSPNFAPHPEGGCGAPGHGSPLPSPPLESIIGPEEHTPLADVSRQNPFTHRIPTGHASPVPHLNWQSSNPGL